MINIEIIDQHCLDPELMAPPCVLKHAGGVQACPLCTGVVLPQIKGFAAPNQQITEWWQDVTQSTREL